MVTLNDFSLVFKNNPLPTQKLEPSYSALEILPKEGSA